MLFNLLLLQQVSTILPNKTEPCPFSKKKKKKKNRTVSGLNFNKTVYVLNFNIYHVHIYYGSMGPH